MVADKAEPRVAVLRSPGITTFEITRLPATHSARSEAISTAAQLAGSGEGLELARALADSGAGRELALDLADSGAGRELARALAGSGAGRELARALAGSVAGRELARDLAGSVAGRELARDLAGSDAGRELARDLAGSDAGRELARDLADSGAGRELAWDLADSGAGRELAWDLAGSVEGSAGLVWQLTVLGGLCLWLGIHLIAGQSVVLYVAGVATRVDEPDDDHRPEEESVRGELAAAGVDALVFDPTSLDAETVLAIKGLLEQLVGLTTELILSGKFEHDPAVEARMNHDRDALQFELFHNLDGPDGSALAPHAQRVIAGIIPVLDDGPGKELLQAIAGQPDRDPQSADAADRAIERADQVANSVTAEQLTQAQQEVHGDEPLPPITRPERYLAEVLGWVDPAVRFVGPASGVTTILLAAGVSGPWSIVLGATLGLLWLYRPRTGN